MVSDKSQRSAATMPELVVHGTVSQLAVILGDQLNTDAEILRQLNKTQDAILMMEVEEETKHVISHKQRIVLFLAAMRHFAMDLLQKGYRVHYVRIDNPNNTHSFCGEIIRAVQKMKPKRIVYTQPGEWRVKMLIDQVVQETNIPQKMHPDRHFLVDLVDFDRWMADRKKPIMEHFYRDQRRRIDVLIQENGKPTGGIWNLDKENRKALRSKPAVKKPYSPNHDLITEEVIQLVDQRFANHPGSLNTFRWPITRKQALRALDDFVKNRLADFGKHQDAMWADEPFLYHSLLSAPLNLKLLDPRECVAKAVTAYENRQAPLNSVEGFIRQIIGWREFIHGIYWHEGPRYRERNDLNQHGTLPIFYWTSETDMYCMKQAIGQVLSYGYGHHIQRLMVTGNFALMAGVAPHHISDWYLAMYVDAVDWVTLPNTLGMVMHADGGVVGTKPYAASGKYIERMSNYCKHCPYNPSIRAGPKACPFTTFYWEFLIRNRKKFRSNSRMSMMLRNVARMTDKDRSAISIHAKHLRRNYGIKDTNSKDHIPSTLYPDRG